MFQHASAVATGAYSRAAAAGPPAERRGSSEGSAVEAGFEVDWAAGSGHVAAVGGSIGRETAPGSAVGSSATWRE